METQFKEVPGYNGRYLIGSDGSVISLVGGRRKTRKQSDKGDGYCRIVLSDGITSRTHYVHRLVAESFVSGDTTLTVNHKDRNKGNNHADNLEWITHAANLQHARDMGNWKPGAEAIKKRARKVTAVGVGGEYREFESINAAAREINGDAGTIHQAIKRRKFWYGHWWSYAKTPR